MVKKVETVFVGMSGGVDSSVTAALLKEQGYRVVGVYMKNWSQDLPGLPCPWKQDYQDAKRVAVQLGIDFKMYDFEKEYRHKVVDYMIAEYQAGRTPNPDIMCNQEVKFKLFLDTALADGADLIATGHYARTVHSSGNSKFQAPNLVLDPDRGSKQIPKTNDQNSKHAGLYVAANAEKDQTYFLYRVTEQALARTLMPIGDFETKDEVRALAKKLGLATAAKKDSQGICFVGKVGIRDFLSQYVTTKPGAIKDQNGIVIGEHDGAIFYTIGQRHGLDVGGGLPYYVIGKDMQKNEVYVTTDLDDENLWKNELKLTDVHWINDPPEEGKTYQVRTRYRAPLTPGKIKIAQNNTHRSTSSNREERCEVFLEESVRAVTPGQSAVIYDGDRVVGGGIVV
ncbi:MAG TPA: tRNA 2-thiouridine(34) synthase MnmA [Candidatus Limnocylindria bacterium]|nr:tRNA 2-thiouridine(34) synthase MnmA [Candidatus Limnocylindria bacterium]